MRVKSVQQLNAEREQIIENEIAKIQEESRKMAERYKEEARKREEAINKEKRHQEEQERRNKELMSIAIKERDEKELRRKEELKRQQSLLSGETGKMLEMQRRKESLAKIALLEEEKSKLRAIEKAKKEEKFRIDSIERKKLEDAMAKESIIQDALKRQELARLELEQQSLLEYQKRDLDAQAKKDYGNISRRGSAEPRNFGFGNVLTGQVNSRKINFLKAATGEKPLSSSAGVSRNSSFKNVIAANSGRRESLPSPALSGKVVKSFSFQNEKESGYSDL